MPVNLLVLYQSCLLYVRNAYTETCRLLEPRQLSKPEKDTIRNKNTTAIFVM
ncbi:hypothetical protein Hanom_Chr04g00352651 [Helianthus anomalus]